MKKAHIIWTTILAALLLWGTPLSAQAGWEDLFEEAQSLLNGSGLQNDEIVAGLKEALRIGTANSVSRLDQVGGYLDNPDIRIPLPGPLAKTEDMLRLAGYGADLDAFETSMNRAAEKAAPQAKDIFWEAINEMTLDDAQQILNGGDTAATDYFAKRTWPKLTELFTPIVHDSLASVGATRKFQELDATVKSLPFGDALSFDLDQYVTDGALNGLFTVLGEEERKIRQDPAARTTELLKNVFGAAK